MSHQKYTASKARKGFSLIELVIVVVIIGIIAAIAIPKMSKGSAGAGDSALQGNLAVLRNAIELYNAEHGALPGATLKDQLSLYTNAAGATNASKTTTYSFGPYLRKIPALPVGSKKGNSDVVIIDGTTSFTLGTGTEGWVYNSATGDIKANLADTEVVAGTSTKYNEF